MAGFARRLKTALETDDARWLIGLLVGAVALLGGLLLLKLSADPHRAADTRWLMQTFGGFLTGSVLVSFLYKFAVQPMDTAKRKRDMRALLDEKIGELITDRFEHGFQGLSSEMDYDSLFDELEPGDELWWLDTYAPTYKSFLENLRRAAERGAHLKFLVLKPGSANAKLRAEEIGSDYRTSFEDELKAFHAALTHCAATLNAPRGSIEIRTYEDLLGAAIYVVCRDGAPKLAHTSFYLGKATGVKFPHLVWRGTGKGGMIGQFFAYVREKWQRQAGASAP